MPSTRASSRVASKVAKTSTGPQASVTAKAAEEAMVPQAAFDIEAARAAITSRVSATIKAAIEAKTAGPSKVNKAFVDIVVPFKRKATVIESDTEENEVDMVQSAPLNNSNNDAGNIGSSAASSSAVTKIPEVFRTVKKPKLAYAASGMPLKDRRTVRNPRGQPTLKALSYKTPTMSPDSDIESLSEHESPIISYQDRKNKGKAKAIPNWVPLVPLTCVGPSTLANSPDSGSTSSSGTTTVINPSPPMMDLIPSQTTDTFQEIEDNVSLAELGECPSDNEQMHPDLLDIYGKLPIIAQPVPFTSYGYLKPSVYDAYTSYNMLMRLKIVHDWNKRGLITGLAFTESGNFMNMGRVERYDLCMQQKGFYISSQDSTNPAVGIMLGSIQQCRVVNPLQVDDSGKHVRQVTLLPFLYDLQLNAKAWADVYNLNTLETEFVPDSGIVFKSKPGTITKDVPGTSKISPPPPYSSQPIPKSRLMPPKKGINGGEHPNGEEPPVYPLAKAFRDKIPIYEGRGLAGSAFKFSDEQFKQLSEWPLYEKGLSDVEPEGIVAIGYTTNLWGGSPPKNLSLNLQFVIVLN